MRIRIVTIFFITFFLISITGNFVPGVMCNPEGLMELNNAELRFSFALKEVQLAEQYAGDLKIFSENLKDTLEIIDRSKILYRSGNIVAAIKNANDASSKAIQIEAEAISYRSSASVREEAQRQSSLLYKTLTAISALLVIYIVWRLFKREYMINFMNLKPEAKADES